MDIIATLSSELNITKEQTERTIALIDEGNTIPFIARYRKEVTGNLDDVLLRKLCDRLDYLRKMDARRTEVKGLIAAQDKLTSEIEAAIEQATTLVELDDIYRPFRPRRKTRASVARERGLEPLAALILEQRTSYDAAIEDIAAGYIDPEKGVETVEDALSGACDIVAEDIADNAEYRKQIRLLTYNYGNLVTKQSKDEDSVYAVYYDFSEPVSKLKGYRILAINRAEREGFIKVSIDIAPEIILNWLMAQVVTTEQSPAYPYVMSALSDGYTRLIAPSIEREIRSDLFNMASEGAIKLFSENLRNLLMQAPLRGKTVIGYDPGYRTGCKLAVVDKTGKVLDTAVIYPTKPRERIEESARILKNLVNKYGVEVIAIGNGTVSRESEIFVADCLKEMDRPVKYIIVSEAGASVYSASKLGAEEFPDFDVTERSAVSIARRLLDPLAELVKIDPKSIGVGQYQHDMKPARLDGALSGVVEDCVNRVGVEINTASHSLLSYVAGINGTAAKNIVKYREEHGEFKSRAEILKVPRIGARAYEQCAGFLRVSGSDEVLDNTGVHPESYDAARKLLRQFGYTERDVKESKIVGLSSKIKASGIEKVSGEIGVGELTLMDIAGELEKPGRDIRDSLPEPELRADVMSLSDLKAGMMLKGTVRNIVDFGAFVDIGVHCDGLLHVSEIADRYIAHPREVLAIGDIIDVRIKSVDVERKRISLTKKPISKISNILERFFSNNMAYSQFVFYLCANNTKDM